MTELTVTEKIETFFSDYTQLQYKKRQTVLSSHDENNFIYYVSSGYIRAFRLSENGDELTLHILKPGDFFPMTYGMNNLPNIYYLEALTPLSVKKAPINTFLDFITASPDVFFTLTSHTMDRFDGLLARMEYMTWSSAYTRIAAVLFNCAKQFGKIEETGITIQIPLTHRDIATLVGLTRETTSIEMKKLEKKGIITRRKKMLTIHNMNALESASLLGNEPGLLANHFL